MEACADQKENIILYAYGDLDAGAVKALEYHLETCEGCRREKQRLIELLGKIERTTTPPEMSPQEVQSLAKKITRTLESEREATWWRRYLNFSAPRMKPAFALACVLLIAIVTVRYLSLENGNEFQISSNHQDTQLILSDRDLEILRNLELLKAMDTIQKLTNVVDPGDNLQFQEELKRDKRGTRRNGRSKAYV